MGLLLAKAPGEDDAFGEVLLVKVDAMAEALLEDWRGSIAFDCSA
jgi:hypothetical protein